MRAGSGVPHSAHAGWLRAAEGEIRFAWWSHHFLWMLLGGLVAGVFSAMTLNGMAANEARAFEDTVSDARANGVDVDAELHAPIHVQVNGNSTTIDNPVRYDYDRARNALGMLRPAGYSANAAQVAGFLLAPLVAFGAGLALSVKDFRLRTIRVRAVRSRLGALESAYALTAGLEGIATVIGAIAAALATGVLTAGPTSSALVLDALEPVPDTAGPGGVAAWTCFAVVAALFFGTVGVAAGLLTRALIAPMGVFTAFHLMVPILGPLDPRAMVLSVGTALAPLSGTLQLRPISGALPTTWNVIILVAQAIVLLLLARIALAIRPRWGGP